MKSLAMILAGLYLSWRYTDVQSDQALYSVWAPLACMGLLIALVAWAFRRLAPGGSGASSVGYSDEPADFGGGSDSGGSDSGGGD